MGRMFEVKVGPAFDGYRRRYESLLEKYAYVIEKTTDLFMRVDTTQAEILATVIFTATALKQKGKSPATEMDVLEAVMQWKQARKPRLDKTMVASTIRNLGILHWLEVQPDGRLPVSEESEIYA